MKNDGKLDKDDGAGLDASEDAALWDLLGRAERPVPGPYFARRVLREVSLAEEAGQNASGPGWQPALFWSICRRVGRIALLASSPVAAVFLLFMGLQMNPVGGQRAANTPVPDAAVPAAPVEEGSPAQPAPNVAVNHPVDEVSAQDVEVIAELDTLLKREQSRLWTEDDTARF